MHRALIAILLCALGSVSAEAAEGLLVWMEPEVPEERAVQRVERLTGTPLRQVAHPDLAFAPQPPTSEDKARFSRLQAAIEEGRSQWHEFEVEYDIAVELEGILATIDLVRDDADRDLLVRARAMQGAAVVRAFDPRHFNTEERARPFRIRLPGVELNRPWVEAAALTDGVVGRDHLVDGSNHHDLQEALRAVDRVPDARLAVDNLPGGITLVIDGRVHDDLSEPIPLRPGTHYVHVLRHDVISGRQRVEAIAGDTSRLKLGVGRTALDQARARVLEGVTVGLPDDVKAGIDLLAAAHPGPIYVAAYDQGRVTVLPYARGAQLSRNRPVTVVAAGEVGGGVVVSPIFDDSDGQQVTAPTVSGALSLEIGIYNVAILGGFDMAITPAHTVTHGNRDLTDNVVTSTLPQPWGGLGLYLVRPMGTGPTLLVAGTYGWDGPAHMAMGGRMTLGFPVRDSGNWFRLTLGGSTAASSMWDEGGEQTPMHVGFFRMGLGSLF